MRQGTCCECGVTGPIRSFYSFNTKVYCEPCVRKASQQANERGEPSEYASLTDNSTCARCGVYSGDAVDHPVVGKLPLCPNCAPQVTDWPYPVWLKAGLAVLLVLLAIALVHGRKYFHSGRMMYVGERLMDDGRFAEALPYLQETLRVAPSSDKAVLLTAKAALKIGDVDAANKALQGHDGGRFEDGKDGKFLEVNTLWERAIGAMDKAGKANKLMEQDGHAAEAAHLMHEAAASYPEASFLAVAAEEYDEGAAFERMDYDAYLSMAEKQWKDRPGSFTTAAVASALACKYAVTGDVSYRKQSEEMLQKAQQQAQGNPDEMKGFQEFAERIHYRLDSRQVIGKQEYERKFRSGQKQEK
jgi:tetratricopeptide (TPR) repeat protein